MLNEISELESIFSMSSNKAKLDGNIPIDFLFNTFVRTQFQARGEQFYDWVSDFESNEDFSIKIMVINKHNNLTIRFEEAVDQYVQKALCNFILNVLET